ncbi:hypothetical protein CAUPRSCDRAFT_11299 [Caulochytrium protostelioides]|uniref:Uncharacterized protein n=1 Tax=Caulochytrium protostelioides TaxID=1555241 RepID=A0A4P9WXM4_9FUNG|nr:hypothetical protein CAUPRSCDRAFT_11299 [Caulochytrium protostelioides]
MMEAADASLKISRAMVDNINSVKRAFFKAAEVLAKPSVVQAQQEDNRHVVQAQRDDSIERFADHFVESSFHKAEKEADRLFYRLATGETTSGVLSYLVPQLTTESRAKFEIPLANAKVMFMTNPTLAERFLYSTVFHVEKASDRFQKQIYLLKHSHIKCLVDLCLPDPPVEMKEYPADLKKIVAEYNEQTLNERIPSTAAEWSGVFHSDMLSAYYVAIYNPLTPPRHRSATIWREFGMPKYENTQMAESLSQVANHLETLMNFPEKSTPFLSAQERGKNNNVERKSSSKFSTVKRAFDTEDRLATFRCLQTLVKSSKNFLVFLAGYFRFVLTGLPDDTSVFSNAYASQG